MGPRRLLPRWCHQFEGDVLQLPTQKCWRRRQPLRACRATGNHAPPPLRPPPPTHAGCAHREHFIYVRSARASVSIAACLALPRVPPRLGKHTGRQWQRDCHGPVHAAASALSIPRTAHPTYSFYVKLVTGMRTGAHKSRRSGRCAELPGPADRTTV